MSVLFYLDASGQLCSGLQSELPCEFLKALKTLPNPPLDDADIAWPDGERFAHQHYAGALGAADEEVLR